MSIQIYIDGQFYSKDEAKVSVFDHGFLYGDGIFEGIRAYNGRVWKLDEHLKRLYDSAKAIMLEIPLTVKEMEEVVLETLRRSGLTKDSYIRLVISRGKGDLGLDPRKCPKPSVICIADSIKLYPEEVYTEGMKVISVSTRRNPVDTLSPQVKTLNYMTGIMAKITANLHGYPEVIMLNKEGYVTEGTGDNIFIVKNGKIITPPAYLGILPGITRNAVIEMAKELGLPVEEGVFTLIDVYGADECFLTGTAAEVIPVVMADGRSIGDGKPGEITWKLIRRFRELTQTVGTPIVPAVKA
jgi:branched-chain amino acid aminotransferase